MISTKDPLGYQDVKKIIARTFYPESAKRLERLGFKKVDEISGDVVPERTSYYYEADVNDVLNRFSRVN